MPIQEFQYYARSRKIFQILVFILLYPTKKLIFKDMRGLEYNNDLIIVKEVENLKKIITESKV